MTNYRKGSYVNCAICDKSFYAEPARLRKRNQHACSQECSWKLLSLLNNKQVMKKCEVCGKEILYKKSRLNKIVHHTCSFECRCKLFKTIFKSRNHHRFLNLGFLGRFFWDKCSNYKHRAKIKNLDFDLDYQFLIEIYNQQKGCCYYTGIEMKLIGEMDFDTLSLDRINSDKGYTKDNVVFCLLCVNFLKSNYEISKINMVLNSLIKKNKIRLKIKRLFPDAKLPSKNNDTDAGYDIYVHRFEEFDNYVKIYSGIAIQPEEGYYTELFPRSSIYKKGLILHNSVGIIDQSYTGEVIGVLYKTNEYKGIEIGDRLLQIIPRAQYYLTIFEVNELNSTERGELGFGSSGT